MAVITPGLDRRGLMTFNGVTGRGRGPAGQDFSSSIFYNASRGVPRYEDLLTIRVLSQTHTVSVPLDTIKGQVTTTEWTVAPTVDKPTSRHNAACDEIVEFLDGGFNSNPSTFDSLCKEWLNDILSIDAGVLELVPGDDGFLAEIYPRDGATFTKNPDRYGRLPPPGSDTPAYWQVGAQAGGVFRGTSLWNNEGLPAMDSLIQHDLALAGMLGYRAIEPIPFSRDQIVWIEENPQTWRAYGYSRIQKVQRLVEILINQDVSNLKYFPANEVPEGALNLVEANQTEIERFREYWSSEIAGKPHKMPILGAKNIQWIPFRASPRELEFLASQEWYNNLVWMAFGLAPSEVGYVQDVNRSTAQEMAEAVWRKTTLPLLELLRNAINRFILPFLEQYWDVDGEVEFVWDPHNPVIDRQRRLEQENDLRHALTTPNRVLLARGEDPVAWGDMPLTLIDSLARLYPEWFAGEICGIENVPESIYGGSMLLSATNPVTKTVAEMVKAGRRPDPNDEPDEWRSRIDALHRRVQGVFDDTLQNLRQVVESVFPQEVPDGDAESVVDIDSVVDQISIADQLIATTAAPRADAFVAGIDRERKLLEDALESRVGKSLYRVQITKEFDPTKTIAYKLLQQRAARNMRGVEDSVKDLVRNTLTRVVEDGGNVTDAWQALQRDVPEMTSAHARLVARTEILGAQRYGKQALGEEVEHILKGKVWRSRKIPGRTRPWHSVMDGVTVPVRESWTVPAGVAPNQPKDYPKQAYVVGEDQPYNCMCDQRLALADDLPVSAQELRAVKDVSIEPLTKQAEILLDHALPHESLPDCLARLEKEMSRTQLAKHLGISKATLYEWLRQADEQTLNTKQE